MPKHVCTGLKPRNYVHWTSEETKHVEHSNHNLVSLFLYMYTRVQNNFLYNSSKNPYAKTNVGWQI